VPILAVLLLAGIVAIALLLKLLTLFAKAFKSWIFGITSALIVWWGVSFCVFFSRDSLFLFQQLKYPLSTAMLLTIIRLAPRVRALESSTHISEAMSFAVPERDDNAGRQPR
jgi:hypothetical protein